MTDERTNAGRTSPSAFAPARRTEIMDAGFEQARQERVLRAKRDQIRDPDFWRALNPDLTISDLPFSRHHEPFDFDAADVETYRAQLAQDGYFQTPPVVRTAEAARLRAGIARVAAAGFVSTLACVYDEFYSVFQGLDRLFAPLLGADFRLIVQGMWAYHVMPGDPAITSWGAAGPHRDSMTPDPTILAGQPASVVNVWLPLTDVTPLHSCIYCLPAALDPDFYTDAQSVPEKIRWQDIRAMPAAAGSLLSWSTNLVHWGSRSSPLAAGPRTAVAVYFERGDLPLRHPFTIRFGDRVTFDQRLRWIEANLGRPGLFGPWD